MISIPVVKKTSLPPPLFFPNLTFNVLGTQTIIPAEIIKSVNLEREKRGRPPLIINDKLMQAAKFRAEVIIKYQNFSHQDPYEHIELVTVLPLVGYNYIFASENIGMGGVSAEDFVGGFMNSISHRENLLNGQLKHSGAAVISGQYRQYYVNVAVQLFAVPATKEEYLGYNTIDKKNYKNQLDKLNLQLTPAVIYIDQVINKKAIPEEKLNFKRRQKEILEKLYQLMKEEKPFEEEQVSLVKEYNSYL